MQPTREILKTTPVSEADKLLPIQPCIVPAHMSLHDVAVCVARRPEARVISVVDEQQRLVGLIPIRTLVEDVFFQFLPEEFMEDLQGFDQSAAFVRLTTAHTAGDVMQPPVAVTTGNTVKEAFERMHDHKLAGLPIVDTDGRVVGYLDLIELLLLVLRAESEAQS